MGGIYYTGFYRFKARFLQFSFLIYIYLGIALLLFVDQV